MSYLRVDCGICGAYWNYYEEKYEPLSQTTAVNTQGCVCPNCGSIGGFIGSAGSSIELVATEPLVEE